MSDKQPCRHTQGQTWLISAEEGTGGGSYFYCRECGDIVSEECALCGHDLNPYDVGTWKEVKGWVGGPKKDSMRLREDTGRHAHNACVEKLQAGQAVDQPTILEG